MRAWLARRQHLAEGAYAEQAQLPPQAQPPPDPATAPPALPIIAGAIIETSRFAGASQFGQSALAAPDMGWRRSKRERQTGQTYS